MWDNEMPPINVRKMMEAHGYDFSIGIPPFNAAMQWLKNKGVEELYAIKKPVRYGKTRRLVPVFDRRDYYPDIMIESYQTVFNHFKGIDPIEDNEVWKPEQNIEQNDYWRAVEHMATERVDST
jgi:predicted CoA-binding protein